MGVYTRQFSVTASVYDRGPLENQRNKTPKSRKRVEQQNSVGYDTGDLQGATRVAIEVTSRRRRRRCHRACLSSTCIHKLDLSRKRR